MDRDAMVNVVQRMKVDMDRMYNGAEMSQHEQVAFRQAIVQLTNAQIALKSTFREKK